MKTRFLVHFGCVLLALALGATLRADDAARFSKTLSASESTAIGLAQLDSDQIAALDALVRRDIASADYVYKTPRAARFTERLAPEERHAAGLDRLDAAQLAALDAAVAKEMPAPREPIPSATIAAATDGANTAGAVRPSLTLDRRPQIHGQVSLMVGAGSGGFSEYGGALVLSYDDPAHNFSLIAGYSEVHTKGGYYYRGCRDGYLYPGDWLLP